MRLFRGAGRTGLRGIAPVRQITAGGDRRCASVMLIRPLLDAHRREVMEFLEQRKLTYRNDSSNKDLFFLRNWIRLKLMPQVSEKFGDSLAARLCAQAQVLREEEDYLADLTRQQLANVSNGKKLNRKLFLNVNKALQRRVIRLWIEQRRGHLRAYRLRSCRGSAIVDRCRAASGSFGFSRRLAIGTRIRNDHL